MNEPQRTGHLPSPAEQRSRRARNVAIGLSLGFLVVLFYLVTIAKLAPGFFSGHP